MSAPSVSLVLYSAITTSMSVISRLRTGTCLGGCNGSEARRPESIVMQLPGDGDLSAIGRQDSACGQSPANITVIFVSQCRLQHDRWPVRAHHAHWPENHHHAKWAAQR